jgi:DNA-binding response OmpR family regulator
VLPDRSIARRGRSGPEVWPPDRILVVELDPVTQRRVSETLRAAGFEVDVATSVVDGLDALADRTYDVVLADYEMPDLPGLSLLAALEGAAPTTPRILYAEVVTDELRAQALGFGIFAVLAKPALLEVLLDAIEAALGHAVSGRLREVSVR